MSKNRVVLCSRCGKTTTEDDAFVNSTDLQGVPLTWVCKECLLIQEAVAGLTPEVIREFATGATRDTNSGKLAYDKALSVQVLQAYLEYLGRHRTLKDGSLRDWSNWKQGIPPDVYRESLLRHVVDTVRKSKGLPLREETSLKDLLSAVMFNSMGWLFELLVAESNNRELEDK